MWHGVAISPGVAVARAFRLDEMAARHRPAEIDAAASSSEVARFDEACERVAAELDSTAARVAAEVGESEAGVFRAHRQMLRDPALAGKVTQRILRDHLDAYAALQATLDEYAQLFSRIEDEYLRERMADIRDVIGRIQGQLTLADCPECLESDEPVVLAAAEILPSHTAMFDKLPVVGIITEAGGATGHAAILARSLGIPAVSGLAGLLQQVHTGDVVALDGREGVVQVNPGPEVVAAYRKLQREYVDLRDRLVENRDQPSVMACGTRVELLANVNGLPDAVAAGNVGAEGVGLYRTEYLFLNHPGVPDEDEQYRAYRAVIEASPNRTVTVRTLDLGGDKQVPYFSHRSEANPFMGWRSIRLRSAYPDFFARQLRAIMRAAQHGRVKVLFPMVSTPEEATDLAAMLGDARAATGAAAVEFGVMVEVPAAAVCIDLVLEVVDFVSIGSNDLIQYMMAADRDNPKVAHLCEPFHPAIFRVIHHVIAACERAGKPVTLCGEMAGRPRCVIALLGMGLRRYSMSPAFVPPVKEAVRALSLDVARTIANEVLARRTLAEVKSYLSETMQALAPDVALFDTFA